MGVSDKERVHPEAPYLPDNKLDSFHREPYPLLHLQRSNDEYIRNSKPFQKSLLLHLQQVLE